jgi:type II secretory pathway pseudopilin PulG
MSLAEVLAALAIVGVMITGTMTVVANAHHFTRTNVSKEFATQKAISLLEELKSLVQSSTGSAVVDLDAFDDGVDTTPLLTTQGGPKSVTNPNVKPEDPISGNTPLAGLIYNQSVTKWRFERLITVQKLPGQSNDVRLVNVKVFENLTTGQVLRAEVASVIRTIVNNMPPTQVYDVYALALENVPGWWVYMSNVVPFVRSAINDLQARNPGLIFRTHWITALAYGRDQQYRPFINDIVDSAQAVPWTYFYPGAMPTTAAFAGCCGDNYYYPAFFFNAHMNVDGNDRNGYNAALNPQPYAIADQFNHAMRYVDEIQTWRARRNANPNEEMTWRLLMDDMFMNPQNYTNALVINMHGELMPFPPVRNYSDAAKDPNPNGLPDLRYIRAVTHAEQLRYTNLDNVVLRVYTYLSDPAQGPVNGIMPVPVTIRINGTNAWNPAAGSIRNIHGGVDNDAVAGIDAYDAGPVNAPVCPVAGAPNQMCYSTAALGSDTIIKLFNSPLRSPIEQATGRGLAAENRLYGLEYIPSPVEDLTTQAVQFSTDLTSNAILPKNTARWTITIPAASITNDTILTVETRLGDQVASGVLYPVANAPQNLSRTYVWRGTNAFIFGSPGVSPTLPLTERYQVLGDPRHLPYADLKRPHVSGTFPLSPPAPIAAVGSAESSLGMGYNRYFDDFEDGNMNRGASAEFTGLVPQPAGPGFFVINNSGAGRDDSLVVKIDGSVANVTTTLTPGNRTAAQIAADLNAVANVAFTAVARADVVSGRLRIMSKGRAPTSSVQVIFAAGVAGTGTKEARTATTLGLNDGRGAAGSGLDNSAVHKEIGWPGWFYSVAGQQYGIKNDGTVTNAGWDSVMEFDVHRMFQMLRSSLLRSNAIWTTMTGFSYYYVGIGNEIGYDSANSFPNSIPVNTLPFTGATGWQYENTITGRVRTVRENNGDASWWAKPWIGELYPDTQYANWTASGNLPTNVGTGAGRFIRVNRSDAGGNSAPTPPLTAACTCPLTFGGTALEDANRRTQEPGSTTFFWTGNANSTFHHDYHDGDTANIQPAGTDIADNYSLPVPNNIDNARPFAINFNNPGYNPESFLQPGAYPNAYLTRVLNTYYLHIGVAPDQASSLITVTDPGNFDVAFVAVNGLSPTGISGTTFIAKWSFLSLIQSFLNGGLYRDTSATPTAKHIRQVPHVAITQPNEQTNLKDPATINVSWDTTWVRWDGQQYTVDPSYAGWFENLTLNFAVLYSPSNGVPDPAKGNPTGWFYMQDDTPATLGVRPAAAYQIIQAISTKTTTNSYTWSTPAAKFKQGNYLIRVEAYRVGWALHYAFHQYRAFIQR